MPVIRLPAMTVGQRLDRAERLRLGHERREQVERAVSLGDERRQRRAPVARAVALREREFASLSATIQETIDRLHSSLKEYIEATYHIGDPVLIDQRRQLLDRTGVTHQEPFLETTPRYQVGSRFEDVEGLPPAARTIFETLSSVRKNRARRCHRSLAFQRGGQTLAESSCGYRWLNRHHPALGN
jgi:hypothetical protein